MADPLGHAHAASAFMPHGMCYLWQPGVLGLHVVSDALIALAYFSIPFTLLYFVRHRADLSFNWMFVCFAIFIVACGTTHILEIWTVWQPDYWLSGAVKAATALASVPTAILLVRLVPEALRLPGPSALQKLNAELEARVTERTAQLESANARLMQEVQQRRVAEDAMRSNSYLLRAIVDNLPAVLYVKDVTGRYMLVNRRFEEIFHLSGAEIFGKTDYDIFTKEQAEAFRAMDERVITANEVRTAEETAVQDDGPHAYISVKAPLRNDAGQPYAMFGISTDITDRKNAERTLRAQLERLDLLDRITRATGEHQDLHSIFNVVLHSLEEQLPVDFACACLHEDAERRLTVAAVGPASRTLDPIPALDVHSTIDIDRNGLQRCARGDLLAESDVSTSSSPLAAIFTHAQLRSMVVAPLTVESRVFGALLVARRRAASFTSSQCEFLRQLSQHIALAAHQAQLYADLQTAYEDLRQSQQTILQQERLRALGQMASGIAHDINNALSPATLYVESLIEREKGLSEEGRSSLTVIQRAIDDAAQTVARMREFYRERESRPHALVDVNSAIRQVIDLTRARWSDMPQERGKVITVRTELAPSTPFVLGSENEIRDALTNLVLNAVDAMPEGGTLTLVSRGTSENVVLEARDTGIGMDENTRIRCMEPFFSTKGERGTGLGLAMVYGMVQRHDARIEIDSEPGGGTTVRLIFSLPPQKARASEPTAARERNVSPLHVLLIDDDPLVLKTLRDIVELDGHFVTTANGGQAGIETFTAARGGAESFDVVITDLGMPHIDGRAVARSIKTLSPSTPVMLLTGWGQRMLDERELPEHVDRVLSKPPTLAQLRSALLEAAGRPAAT